MTSLATAFSGGIIRDLIVGRTPFIFTEIYPSLVALLVVFILLFIKFHKAENLQETRLFIISDSIGLATFSIIGALVAIDYSLNWFGVVFAGFLTAVGGSIVRDTLLNKIPYVMVKDFYGTIAIVLAIIIYFLNAFMLINFYSLVCVLVLGVVIRLLAVKYKWKLPKR